MYDTKKDFIKTAISIAMDLIVKDKRGGYKIKSIPSRTNQLIKYYDALNPRFIEKSSKDVQFYESEDKTEYEKIIYRIKRLSKYHKFIFEKKDTTKYNGFYRARDKKRKVSIIHIDLVYNDKIKKTRNYNYHLVKIFCHELAHHIQCKYILQKLSNTSKVDNSRLYDLAYERNADRAGYLLYRKYFKDLVEFEAKDFKAYLRPKSMQMYHNSKRKTHIFNMMIPINVIMSKYFQNDGNMIVHSEYNNKLIKEVIKVNNLLDINYLKHKLDEYDDYIKHNEIYTNNRSILKSCYIDCYLLAMEVIKKFYDEVLHATLNHEYHILIGKYISKLAKIIYIRYYKDKGIIYRDDYRDFNKIYTKEQIAMILEEHRFR